MCVCIEIYWHMSERQNRKLLSLARVVLFHGDFTIYYTSIYVAMMIIISADPGLRQGRGGAWDHRRCGTCFVIALCSWGIQACRLPGFKRLKLLKPSKSLAPPATKPLQTLKTLTTLQLLHCFLAAAATKPSGRQPLLFQGCSLPFACTSLAAHQAPGRQRSSIAACPLPAHSPLLLGHSSLLFARLQTLKTLKTLKTLQLPRGSFHQALWPSAFAVPGLQPALCLHIPRGSFHQAPGRQRSSIAALSPLPAHSPLLLRHSSLPFARLQTLKTLKTLQLPRGSFHLQLLHCFLAAAATKPSGRQPLLFQGCSLPFACTSLAAASTKPSGRQPLLFQGCSLPFSCTSLAAASTKLAAVSVPASKPLQPSNCCTASSRQLPPSPLAVSLCCSRVAACPLPAHPSRNTKLLAVSVPALQPALCLHIALSC